MLKIGQSDLFGPKFRFFCPFLVRPSSFYGLFSGLFGAKKSTQSRYKNPEIEFLIIFGPFGCHFPVFLSSRNDIF